ncbi:hypothetical protein [Desulfosediminicola sp.]|uniref:hypothetical protein n=1 Tax=Desulfosediminicola sp. TaxID=2886825 RepID=UPI003AF29E43
MSSFRLLLIAFLLLSAPVTLAAEVDEVSKPDLTMPAITLFQTQLSVRCLRNTKNSDDYQLCIQRSNKSMQDAIHHIATITGLGASPDDQQAKQLQSCVIQADIATKNAPKKEREPIYWQTLTNCIKGVEE